MSTSIKQYLLTHRSMQLFWMANVSDIYIIILILYLALIRNNTILLLTYRLETSENKDDGF